MTRFPGWRTPHKPTRTRGADPKAEIEIMLKLSGMQYVAEYRFHPPRRFRFDWAIPGIKVAVEFEGLRLSGKSRHTTITGYSKDTEKYNLAALDGWRVLRYTALTYRNLPDDLLAINSQIINQTHDTPTS